MVFVLVVSQISILQSDFYLLWAFGMEMIIFIYEWGRVREATPPIQH